MPLHTVEIRPDRGSESTPESASQIFSSLSSLKSSFFNRLFGNEEPIVFEILSFEQKTHFYAHFPETLSAYIESQVAAHYPKASIVASVNPLVKRLHEKQIAFGELKLSGPNYLPLKTWREFSDSDPLAAVLGTMAKVNQEDMLMVQVVVLPTGPGWRGSGARAISQGVIGPEGEKKAHPKAALIDKKITQNGFRVGIRLLGASSDEKSARQLVSSLAGSFGALTLGESNSLIFTKPRFWEQKKFLTSIIERSSRYVPSKQYLTVDELASVFHLPTVNLSEIKNVTWGGSLLGDPPDTLPTGVGATPEEIAQINFFAKTEFRNQLTNFGIKKVDRRRHVYIVGKSGTGKSTLIANMAINDMINGEGLAVVDPHGDLSEIILDYVPEYRINDVVYLDAAAASRRPFRMNLFEVKNPEQGELVASGVVSIFQKLYGYSWGPRLEYILRNCILTLILRPNSTLVDVPRILTDRAFRKSVVAHIDDMVLKNFWENEFEKMNDKLQTEAISPILNKVGQFVSSPTIREIIGYPQSTIDMEDAMDSGKIVILNLSQGRLGEDNAALLGAMIITKIQLAAMNRAAIQEEQRRDFYLFVDEFQNFATISFVKILSEARKYRLNLTVANQYISQVIEEVQHAIFGNVGTLMSFLVGAQDAQILTREFGQVYKEEDMVSLDNYQIITKLAIDAKTSRPFFAYTLPLPENKTVNRQKVVQFSEEKYTKNAGEGAYIIEPTPAPRVVEPTAQQPLQTQPSQQQPEGEEKKKRRRRKRGKGADGQKPQNPNINDVWRPETGRIAPKFDNPVMSNGQVEPVGEDPRPSTAQTPQQSPTLQQSESTIYEG